MATINISTREGLLSALANARGGDTLVLAAGNYGSVSFAKDFASQLTIKSAQALGATFSNLDFSGAGNIRVNGVHVDNPAGGGATTALVRINNSRNVELVNSEVNGSDDKDYSGWVGIHVQKSEGIRIENNDIHDAYRGLMMFGTKAVEVVGNDFDDIGEDTMKFGGVDTVLIEDNFSTGAHRSGSHLDFIQVQGGLSSNMTVRGNVLLPETGGNMQGVFFGATFARNVLVEDNFIHTRMYNGVRFGDGADITVTNNSLINMEPGKSTAVTAPKGSIVTDNIITKYYKSVGMLEQNLLIQNEKPGLPGYVTDYYLNGDKGLGLRLADLGIVRGSLAEVLGAADRLKELLGLASSPAPPSAPTSSSAVVYSLPGDREIRATAIDVISVAPSAKLALDAATIAFSFEADNVLGKQGLVTRDAYGVIGGGNHFAVALKDNTLTVTFESATKTIEFATRGIQANKEYDVQAAFGNGKVYAWLNGTLIGTAQFATDWTDNHQYLQVGAHNGTNTTSGGSGFDRIFDGTISDLKIVNGLLGPGAIDMLRAGAAAASSLTSAAAPTSSLTSAAAPDGADMSDAVWSRVGETAFDGKDIVKVAHQPAMEVDAGSLAFSFAADRLSGRQGLVSKDAPGGGDHVAAWLKGDTLFFRFEHDSKQAIFKVGGIDAHEEHDVLATFTGKRVALYVDDALVGRKALAMDFADNHETLQIGGWDAPKGEADSPFDGSISDVFLFDQVITPDNLI